jgi:hypothetical protein
MMEMSATTITGIPLHVTPNAAVVEDVIIEGSQFMNTMWHLAQES